MTIHISYDDRLLGWDLGPGHPTQAIRAKNAIDMLRSLGAPVKVHKVSGPATLRDLHMVHSPSYVADTVLGVNSEWDWPEDRPDLGHVARLMFQSTVDCVRRLDRDGGIAFAPQGAKHHAMWGRGSGFCVFADFAWAATHWARKGERVLVVDLDAHHGDGTEALTYGITDVMTASIHDGTIFPGSGWSHTPRLNVLNYPLARGSGDEDMLDALMDALARAEDFDPTVVMIAVGGDGYVDDPLSTLTYTLEGYAEAGEWLGEFASRHHAPVLIGGAGGYLPDTATPACWSTFVASLAEVYTGARV